MSNAWKFCSESAAPRIVFKKEIAEGRTWFVIRDNGVGFDMADAGRMFQPFSRLHGRDEFKGSGVGLAIAERIVRKHGGEIRAEGEPGGGATFRFTLEP